MALSKQELIMAKPDWEAIESAYQTGTMSLRDIGAQHGISEGAIRKKATKLGWVRKEKTGTQSGTQVRKKSTQQNSVRTDESRTSSGNEEKYAEQESKNPPESKRNRRSGNPHPIPRFEQHNQHALKHGGYGRRMLLSDAVSDDASIIDLNDELFWLRAANLTAAESIGRWRSELDDAGSDEEKKVIYDLISSAEKAMHKNTARIESLEYTKASIEKMRVDSAYREAATEKVEIEIDAMKDGNRDNAIVVHNALPIPGR